MCYLCFVDVGFQERFQKRANLIVSLFRKFMVEWNGAYMKELEAQRAGACSRLKVRYNAGRGCVAMTYLGVSFVSAPADY